MDDNWCEVYTLTNDVRTNENLIKDMREEAVAIIFESWICIRIIVSERTNN